jgi:chromosome segregation ATPase
MPDLNEINDSLAEFEEELSKLKSASEMIEEAKNSANTTIIESKKIMEELITNSKKATDSAIQESKKLNDSAQRLFDAVDILMNKLDKVDFPTRLDKLDNSVTGINTAIQNIFGRFETIEKNIKDEFNSKISVLYEKLEKSQKLNWVFLILVSLITGSSLITLLVKLVF